MKRSDIEDEDDDTFKGAPYTPASYVKVDLEGNYNGSSLTDAGTSGDQREPPRLLLVSSKVKLAAAIAHSVLSNVVCVQYKYEACNLDGILVTVAQALGNYQQVESIGLVLSCSGSLIYLCGRDEKILSKECVLESKTVREFFSTLAMNHLDKSWANARLDFLMCSAAVTIDGGIISKELEAMIGVPIGISKDLYGTDIPYQRFGNELPESSLSIGQLYFRLEKLRAWSGSHPQSLAGFEKIRTVGKGAYGAAVLYRKKDDDTLVILKEINMHDLNASERQMALNEIKVLAMLEHPNIIGYYDSFEEDGVLMIEMEYADGGTLAQYLAACENSLDEKEILEKFSQIVNALKHIHGHNVLHRDLKTANIFLTKDGIVKLGDFGISKMMTTGGKAANTVLGTPYYISPEICEGKPYGGKSDIWALGCILYEMACLQRTFEGSNLPALVHKIMNGQFAPVKGNYSMEFKDLVQIMLDKEPQKRPSADELCTTWLPPLLSHYEVSDMEGGDGIKTLNGRKSRRMMSALYYLETFNMSLHPIEMPMKVKIKEVAVSVDHVIVVTTEHMIYSWGEGSKGQLGHGDIESRTSPYLVEALKGKSINRACCGDGFSVFSSNNGIVITCGDGSKGCLGHGDHLALAKPKLVESLLHMDVVSIACGLHHIVAVGNKGSVYAWGKGADGRLGTGNEDDQCTPVQVLMPDDVFVTRAFCGMDGTMLVTDIGRIWAFGNNEHNKLGLNNRQGFLAALKNAFSKTEVEGAKAPAVVRDLGRHKVIEISMGQNHTAVIAESGNVYTLGRNLEGQLGAGNAKEHNGLNHVKTLEKTKALKVRCSDLYTAVSTADGQLLFWGTKYISPPPQLDTTIRSNRTSASLSSSDLVSPGILGTPAIFPIDSLSLPSSGGGGSIKEAKQSALYKAHTLLLPAADGSRSASPATVATGEDEPKATSVQLLPRSSSAGNMPEGGLSSPPLDGTAPDRARKSANGEDLPKSRGFRPLSAVPRRTATSATPSKEKLADKFEKAADDCTVYFQPTPLLHMNSESTESVTLADFSCHGENVFVLVETTAPPATRRMRKRRSLHSMTNGVSLKSSASSQEAADEMSSEASEMDTFGTVPSWIREELRRTEVVKTSDISAEADTAAQFITDEEYESDEEGATEDAPSGKLSIEEQAQWADHNHYGTQSIASIRLNDSLRPTAPGLVNVAGSNSKPLRQTRVGRAPAEVLGSERQKASSPESGIDNIDEMSSSYSDSNEIRAAREDGGAAAAWQRSSVPARAPLRDTAGGQVAPMRKPAFIPAPSLSPRSRRSRAIIYSEVDDGNVGSSGDSQQMRASVPSSSALASTPDDKVRLLLEQLMEEKRHQEEHVKDLEDKHREKEQQIRLDAQRHAAEREKQMQDEIRKLREELNMQHRQMQENFNMVVALQQQLVRSSMSQQLPAEQQQHHHPAIQQQKQKQPPQAKSTICSLM